LGNLKRASGDRLPGTIDLTSAANYATLKGKSSKANKNAHHVDVALQVR
jgi:hypothetical protein